MELRAHGIRAALPPGWEGVITRERADDVAAAVATFSTRPAARPLVLPVAHFATFPLPAERGDYGGGAVEGMGSDDVFVALLEFAAEEAGSALFATEGLPRHLDPARFSPRNLQRTLAGHAGLQVFFHDGGRAFCLYVVVGDARDATRLARRVEQVLRGVVIEPRR